MIRKTTMSYYKSLLAALLACLITTACTSEIPEESRTDASATECVAADDWGDPKVFVKAQKNIDFSAGESIGNQSVDWVDSGQILLEANNIPLTMSIGVNQQWTSWYNGNVDPTKICQFTDDNCPKIIKSQGLSTYCKDENGNPLAPQDMVADCFVPCWINHANGLYMLLGNSPENIVYKRDTSAAFENSDDPFYSENIDYETNELYDDAIQTRSSRSIDIMRTMDPTLYKGAPVIGATNSPDAFTMHLGKIALKNELTPNSRDLYLTNETPAKIDSSLETGNRLYFKIMDIFYADNAGAYKIRIHSGTRNADPGPLELVMGTIESVVNLAAEAIYKAVVSNADYIRIVQALLVLYIALYGAKFMLGMDNTHNVGNFLTHVFKVAIFIQLISPSSWEFFYVYFFRIFTEGVTGLLGLLASPFAAYDPHSPWYSLDTMLANVFSLETWIKISSLFFSHPILGIFMIIALGITMLYFLAALLSAALTYAQSYILMGFLLVLFPIMLLFILIKRTRWFFDEWVKQMVAIAIELILLFGALGLFSMLIMTYMEKTLGYRVCWMPIFGTEVHGSNAVIPHAPPFLNTILPLGVFLPNVTELKAENYRVGTDQITGEPIVETRYLDAPYLDTENSERDKKQFEKVKNTRYFYLNILELLPLLFAVYLVHQFIARVLPDLSGNLRGGIAGASESAGIYGKSFKKLFTNVLYGSEKSSSSGVLGDRIESGMFGGAKRGLLNTLTFGAYGAASEMDKKANAGRKRRGGLLSTFANYKAARDLTKAKLEELSKDRTKTEQMAKLKQLEERETELQRELKKQTDPHAKTEKVEEENNVIAANEPTGFVNDTAKSAAEKALKTATQQLQGMAPGLSISEIITMSPDKIEQAMADGKIMASKGALQSAINSYNDAVNESNKSS